ncbi:hypothetical protein PVAP13_9NG116873 [Panicum virgatum]|uniref:Uncharacterized protein n=1 Tax=Panicum virgatum TaxID=38727 RepID=A0A8T0MHC0_PANVG|nr:hypothetical protein PVAP13_9NG116873 [Panicum virgatum]
MRAASPLTAGARTVACAPPGKSRREEMDFDGERNTLNAAHDRRHPDRSSGRVVERGK